VRGITRLTWLLPVSSIAFVLYLIVLVIGIVVLHMSIWLIVVLTIPAMLQTWIALVVALVDVTERPRSELTEEARTIWLLILALLNVFAFIPYWLMVVRRSNRSGSGESVTVPDRH
jgi:hypothetical protein